MLDIGVGDGGFSRYFWLHQTYRNLCLIDGNQETVDLLRKDSSNVLHIRIPSRLPFEDSTVSFVHCSHLIEYVGPDELYAMLKEIDRIPEHRGIVIVSAPMPTPDKCYNDLSHVRPYNYSVLTKYLCGGVHVCTRQEIAGGYTVEKLVYR